jgi:uncharacterized membrane protein YhaH (DUF805 family)
MGSGLGAARRPGLTSTSPGLTSMQAVNFLFSPSGRLKPQPFVYGAIAVYVFGAASHFLTTPDVLRRGGLLPFIAVQLFLVWIWFTLHAKRLHDTGRSSGLAVAIGLLYLLSIVLLLIVADGFITTSNMPMGDANAIGALWLLLVLYIVSALAGSSQYDLAWVVVAILTFLAFAPAVAALGFSLWVARKPSVKDA